MEMSPGLAPRHGNHPLLIGLVVSALAHSAALALLSELRWIGTNPGKPPLIVEMRALIFASPALQRDSIPKAMQQKAAGQTILVAKSSPDNTVADFPNQPAHEDLVAITTASTHDTAPEPLATSGKPYLPPQFSAAYLDNPPPLYPQSARRLGLEGTVRLDVLVGRNGRPQEIRLARSSDAADLDQAAQAAVGKWRFVPAKRGDDEVEAWVTVPIRFQLAGYR